MPTTNLVQLDELSELIGNPSVAAGTYSGAVVTLSANPGDVELVTAAEPEAGFPVAGGTAISSAAIQIQGATGSTGAKTVPIHVKFDAPISLTRPSSSGTRRRRMAAPRSGPSISMDRYLTSASMR